jgi:hypothetical protein
MWAVPSAHGRFRCIRTCPPSSTSSRDADSGGRATEGEGTKVTMTYAVGGWASGPLDGWASPVDQVLGIQLAAYGAAATR